MLFKKDFAFGFRYSWSQFWLFICTHSFYNIVYNYVPTLIINIPITRAGLFRPRPEAQKMKSIAKFTVYIGCARDCDLYKLVSSCCGKFVIQIIFYIIYKNTQSYFKVSCPNCDFVPVLNCFDKVKEAWKIMGSIFLYIKATRHPG